jgi:hypothetical protein
MTESEAELCRTLLSACADYPPEAMMNALISALLAAIAAGSDDEQTTRANLKIAADALLAQQAVAGAMWQEAHAETH